MSGGQQPGRGIWAQSIRVRLTLWNVGVLTLILFGMGVALRYTLQVTLANALDHDLMHFGHNIQSGTRQQGVSNQKNMPPPPQEDGTLHPRMLDMQGKSLRPVASKALLIYDKAAFQAALAGQEGFTTVTIEGQRVRVLSLPLVGPDGKMVGVVQLPRPLTEMVQEIRHLTRVLFLLAGPAVILAGIGGAFLTDRSLRPVRQITHTAARIEAEDLSRRLTVTGRDELSELARTFNGMLARLEEAFGQRAAAYDRMENAYEQQRRFTADASHELKSPLTVIEGTASLMISGSDRTPEQYRKAMATIHRSAGTMTHIVQDLLLLARSDAGELRFERRPLSLYEVVALAQESVGEREEAAAIILPESDPGLIVEGEPNPLTRLFVNLIDNARRHTPTDGSVTVSFTADSEGYAIVTVADTGVGIAPEHLPHLFERFYRVDTARARKHGGTGLGLAICRSIAEAHGGTISIESAVGQGTQVSVRLPRVVK